MKKIITLILAFSFVLVLATTAFAKHKKGMRGHAQKHRIHEGIKSGELTKNEVKKIRGDRKQLHDKLKSEREAARADGTVTKEEREAIQKDKQEGLNKMSDEIHDLKNNDETQEK